MKRLFSATGVPAAIVLAAIVLALGAPAALAEEVPTEARASLWCGLAFGIVTAELPSDATPDQQALVQRFADGAKRLLEEAREAYLAQGYTEARFTAYREAMKGNVMRQVNAVAELPEFSFEECSALLNLQ